MISEVSTSHPFINQFLRIRSKRNPGNASQIIHHDECLQGRTPAVGQGFGNLTYGLKEQSPEEKNRECSKTSISSPMYGRENVRVLIKVYQSDSQSPASSMFANVEEKDIYLYYKFCRCDKANPLGYIWISSWLDPKMQFEVYLSHNSMNIFISYQECIWTHIL